MHTLRRVLLAALVVGAALPTWAAAGGWWSTIQLNRSVVAPGEHVTARAEVLFPSVQAARRAEGSGDFHVYLLDGFDDAVVERAMRDPGPGSAWWSPGGARLIEIGPVVVDRIDGNVARVEASFTVPDLDPRPYALMFCDLACRRPLGDVVPVSRFRIAESAFAARVVEQASRLRHRIRTQGIRLGYVAANAGKAEQTGNRALGRAAVATARVESLTERLERLERLERRVLGARASSGGRLPDAAVAATGGLVGAASVLAALALRRRARRRDPLDDWDPEDEAFTEVVSSR